MVRVEAARGCGAYVSEIDLAALRAGEGEALRAALANHGVLYFRDQRLTPEQHIALAHTFGEIDLNRYFPASRDYPEIALVEKLPDQTANIGGGWHTDHSYDAEPAMGSILVARELPAQGGSTRFADLRAAYRALDPAMKARVATLRGVHASEHIYGETGFYAMTDQRALARSEVERPQATHPMIIQHPERGEPVLYVNPAFTVGVEGLSRDDANALLTELYIHAVREEFVHQFDWKPGSVAIWDNRSTWHFAVNDYHGEYRLMHRITIAGGPLSAA